MILALHSQSTGAAVCSMVLLTLPLLGGTRADLAGPLRAAAGRKVVPRVGSGTAGHGEAGSQRAELRTKLKLGFSGFGPWRADEDSLQNRKRG